MAKKVRRVTPRKTALVFEPQKPRETKSKDLHLLIKPSTYDGIKEIATENGLSLNEYVNQLFEAIIEGDK